MWCSGVYIMNPRTIAPCVLQPRSTDSTDRRSINLVSFQSHGQEAKTGGRCASNTGLGSLLCIPALFLCINMPDDVIWQAIDTVAGPLGHFGKSLCLCLVLKGVAGKVDSYSFKG